MRIGLLGHVRVTNGDDVFDVVGAKQRALLALLAVHAGVMVSTDRLLDELWGENLPDKPANALQKQVSELRKVVGADRVVHRGDGYLLDVAPTDVDTFVFEAKLRAARTAMAADRTEDAAGLFVAALGEWRGPPLVGLVDVPFARAETARLEELRWAAIEDRVAVDLMLGRHHDLTAELSTLVAEQPLRERLIGHLMVALYRDGRQAEALRAYTEARRVLTEELGLEPGPELRALEAAILAQEPGLAGPDLTTNAPRTNLRAPITSFVGREHEQALLVERLERHRLVTLTGPGGTGKTRLAVEVAGQLVPVTNDGVWMAELAPIREPHAVAVTVAHVVGARDEGGEPVAPLERVLNHLRDRHTVLVLDNCEHVLDAAGALASAVLAACPDVRILATSRQPLGIAGEAQVPVPGLHGDAAVRLFAERAEGVRPNFDTESDSADVALVCAQLDGLPLAIELAAARVKVLPVAQIAERLQDRFRLLSTGARDAAARHRTLRAAVEWSYELLFEDDRAGFRALSAFPTSFDLEAAEAVCRGAGLEGVDVFELVARLVDKSLLVRHDGRYRMLETLRQFGLDRLGAAGELNRANEAHAHYFLDMVAQNAHRMYSQDQVPWLDTVDMETDNLRSALGWAIDHDRAKGLAIVVLLAPSAWVRGQRQEVRYVMDTLLALGPPAASIGRCRALRWAALLADATGWTGKPAEMSREMALGEARSAEAVALATELGDDLELAYCQRHHAVSLVRRGTATGDDSVLAEAEALLARCEATFAAHGHRWAVGISLVTASFAALGRGHQERAEQLCDRVWPLAIEQGERVTMERVLFVRALLAENRGDTPSALSLHTEALGLALQLGYPECIALHRDHLQALPAREQAAGLKSPYDVSLGAASRVAAGNAAFAAGDLDRAAVLYRAALGIYEAANMAAARSTVLGKLDQIEQGALHSR